MTQTTTESQEFVETNMPCPMAGCGSSDAYNVNDKGWGHCFSCGANVPPEKSEATPKTPKTPKGPKGPFVSHVPSDIPSRKIPWRVCKSNGYGITSEEYQVADYMDDKGNLVAQKIKKPGKVFSILGDAKKMGLWTKHRWQPGGKRLLITEGETDLLAYQSVSGDKWPAVSLPNGAQSAKKVIAADLDWVSSFETVVLFFDNDDQGQKAAREVSELLPGRACLATVPQGHKDICDAVKAGLGKEVVNAFWRAQPHRPEGIAGDQEILEAILERKHVDSVPTPWTGMDQLTSGIRHQELITLTAGTGIGKSQLCRVLAWHLIQQGHKVGYISLEESLARTGLGLLGLAMGRTLHLGCGDLEDSAIQAAYQKHLGGKFSVFNHFGSMDADRMLNAVRFLRVAEGCEFVFVDHLSILVSGWGDGDERRLIDNVMTDLRSIVQRTGVGMILVAHLKRTDGKKAFEEGGRPSLRDLRGSAAIEQLSDGVWALTRNQQGDDPNLSELWVLKNRFSGLTGKACGLRFNPDTGAMMEDDMSFEAEETPF